MYSFKKIAATFGMAVLIVFASVGYAIAQGRSAQGTPQSTTDISTQQAERQTRINERKNTRAEFVSAERLQRISERCEAAQQRVQEIREASRERIDARTAVYNNALSALFSLQARLAEAGIASESFNTALLEFQGLVASFETQATDRRQAVADLAEMDCTNDPQGFAATLQDARAQQAGTKSAANTIRSYTQDTLKPVLSELKNTVRSQE